MLRSRSTYKLLLASTLLMMPLSLPAAARDPMPAEGAPAAVAMAKTDADMQAVLDAFKSLEPKPIEELSSAQARKQPTMADAAMKVMKDRDIEMPAMLADVETDDIKIPGADGTNLDARVYTPAGADDKTPLPVIVYYHGGGWVIANIDVYDSSTRALAAMTGAIVVSSSYRQGPEAKFPAAHDDAFAVYKWVLANADDFGGDARRVAVAGESAGGNLAINTAIKARDSKVQAPLHQLLVYPVAGVDMNTPSYLENANAKPLNKPMMGWFLGHYLASPDQKSDPRLDLVGKADLKGLPPATIIRAEIDPLRTDGEKLAAKLKQAGVQVHEQTYTGVTHEFFGLGLVVAKARQAEEMAAADLKKALMTAPAP